MRLPFLFAASLAATGACARVTGPLPAVPEPAAGTTHAEPGVSLELARSRAATLRDLRYHVALDVTGRDTARGRVTIELERAAGAGDLVLDFRGLALASASVNGSDLDAAAPWDGHHVTIPARHLRAGANQLRFDFAARIAAAGAAIIAVDEPDDSARYLYTLLVSSDAQLLFPVFDQPDLKARFTWEITAPADWSVLANGALADRGKLANGAVRWRFHPTPLISSYLAAFAAGPWRAFGANESERDEPKADDVARDMRLLVRRSRAKEVDADTLLALNRNALAWLERYFDQRYPFDKLDLLLAPAFPFGGMEHVGAIFYNESNFIFREPPTLTRRLARAATVYHEVAHQWFGDLVTMRWFDDLWLKERVADVLPAQQAGGVRRGRDHRYLARVAGVAQPGPGQEQLRRDRLQQGARHPAAARVPGRRGGVPRGRAAVQPRARVRKRHLAGPACGHR